ncbi:MAG: hypothetical protein U0235_15300 [Polyangiaceae bacterium]
MKESRHDFARAFDEYLVPSVLARYAKKSGSSVRVERTGPVTTILLHRPGAKNAVNATPHALSRAIDEFEADDRAAVAAPYGEGGTRAGADLAVASGKPTMIHKDRDCSGRRAGLLKKPVIAAVKGTPSPVGSSSRSWPTCASSPRTTGVFADAGVPPIDGGTVRLARVVGQGARST